MNRHLWVRSKSLDVEVQERIFQSVRVPSHVRLLPPPSRDTFTLTWPPSPHLPHRNWDDTGINLKRNSIRHLSTLVKFQNISSHHLILEVTCKAHFYRKVTAKRLTLHLLRHHPYKIQRTFQSYIKILTGNLQNSDLGTELRILEPRGSGSSWKWHIWNDSSVCRLRAETTIKGCA